MKSKCDACGDLVDEIIGCPNGNEVCHSCFDAGLDGPEPDDDELDHCPDCNTQTSDLYLQPDGQCVCEFCAKENDHSEPTPT